MSQTDIPGLNRSFGIPGQLAFSETTGGLAVVNINNAFGEAAICLQGAHLMQWTPRGQARVIWLSPQAIYAKGKAIRGGVPVCWPWFGPHPDDPGLPAHGVARTTAWDVVGSGQAENGSTWLALRLPQTDKSLWPYSTPIDIRLEVGRALEIELLTRNRGAETVELSQALHAYFHVGDVRRVRVLGLDGCPYIDKADGGLRKKQAGPVAFAEEVDRIYLDSSDDCLIEDPILKRRIRIAKTGSASTIVWNPWAEKSAGLADLGVDAYLGMVCVETANADADRLCLAPGAEHRLRVRYGVEAQEG